MKVSELLLAMLRAAVKARDVARIIRSEQTLLELLVEEKRGAEKNERFRQDFKTLADVLIQQMVQQDIAAQFPEMEGSIFGEESNKFTNALGETTTIRLCSSQEETKQLLKDILDDNDEAASLLSQVAHEEAQVTTSVPVHQMQATLPGHDLGIWIDPIDSTAQYIRGQPGDLDSDGVTNGGLQCVAVLIGAFQKSTGQPVIGVAVQPFWELDPVTQQWSDQITWGVCYQDLRLSSVERDKQQSGADTDTDTATATIIMSTSESDAVKTTLSKHFHLRFASGAGYKLLCTAQRRVHAYVLSKSSIYLWDCCAPHAILRATGGGLLPFHAAPALLPKPGTDLRSDVSAAELGYSSKDGTKSIDGIIAFSSLDVLEKIVLSLAK